MRRKPTAEEENLPCGETMKSIDTPGHTHTCMGGHFETLDHFCGDCRKWWGKARTR